MSVARERKGWLSANTALFEWSFTIGRNLDIKKYYDSNIINYLKLDLRTNFVRKKLSPPPFFFFVSFSDLDFSTPFNLKFPAFAALPSFSYALSPKDGSESFFTV